MKADTSEHLKPRSQYAEDAVQLAIAGKWDEAVKLNRFIIENFGSDEETQNRLGKALSELGKLKEAKASYEVALKLNPMNNIAKKNAARINALLHQKEGLKVGGTRVDLNLFVEEMGKTVITTVESPPKADICSKVAAGDVAAHLFPTLRRGDNDPDVTLLTYGGMLPVVEAAGKRLADEEELAVEIVVPSLLAPLARATLIGRENSALMLREWPAYTGTRTQVPLTRRSGIARILRLSLRSFWSSSVSPDPSSTSDPASGITLNAMGATYLSGAG